jgi:hypothetical protein
MIMAGPRASTAVALCEVPWELLLPIMWPLPWRFSSVFTVFRAISDPLFDIHRILVSLSILVWGAYTPWQVSTTTVQAAATH